MRAPSARQAAKDIGKNVAALRGLAGLTRPSLAGELEIDRTYLWRIESGKVVPSFLLLERIATHFRVTLDDIRRPATARRPSSPAVHPSVAHGERSRDLVRRGGRRSLRQSSKHRSQ